jgi:hypothetical protein
MSGVIIIGGSTIGAEIAQAAPATLAATSSKAHGAAPTGRGPAAVGTIKAKSGSTLTLSTFGGKTVTVKTTSATAVTKSVAGKLADISSGDSVTVIGSLSGSTLSAQQVVDGATEAAGPSSGGGGPPGSTTQTMVSGKVATVSSGSFTVTKSGGGTVTVRTSSKTRVRDIKASDVSALAVGQTVAVTGATASDGTVTATAIQQGPAGPAGMGPGRPGSANGGYGPSGRGSAPGAGHPGPPPAA